MTGRRILLIIGGGIAAFKIPQLIRAESWAGSSVLTRAGAELTTAMTVALVEIL